MDHPCVVHVGLGSIHIGYISAGCPSPLICRDSTGATHRSVGIICAGELPLQHRVWPVPSRVWIPALATTSRDAFSVISRQVVFGIFFLRSMYVSESGLSLARLETMCQEDGGLWWYPTTRVQYAAAHASCRVEPGSDLEAAVSVFFKCQGRKRRKIVDAYLQKEKKEGISKIKKRGEKGGEKAKSKKTLELEPRWE